MKLNRFIVSFGTFVLVTGLLYLTGHAFKIDLLMFHHQYTETSTGFYSETSSLLPFIIGLGVSYIAEKFYYLIKS